MNKLSILSNYFSATILGGVYASAKIIQAARGLIDLSVNRIRSGIWFDYSLALGTLVGDAGIQ